MGKKKKQQIDLERKITKVFLKNPNSEFNYKQISAALNVKDTKGRNEIIKSITKMFNKKKLISPARGKYALSNNQNNIIKGVLEITSTGRGYVVTDDLEEDVAIERKRLNKAFNGDVVTVLVRQKKQKEKPEGEVLEIVQRKKEKFIGVFESHKDYGFVNTRSARMYTDFFINKEDMGGYKTGEAVVVEIKKWEEKKRITRRKNN